MVIISIIGFASTTSITIFSAGVFSLAALFFIGILLTSGPMIFLLWRDITSLRRKGVRWGRTRWLYYLLAIALPAWVMTPIYWFGSEGKIGTEVEQREEMKAAYEDWVSDLPPISECNWTQDDLKRLSDSQFRNIVLGSVDKMKTMGIRGLKETDRLKSGTSNGVLAKSEDGKLMYISTKQKANDSFDDDRPDIVDWFINQVHEHEITVDGGMIYTTSIISREDALDLLYEHNIVIFGGDIVRRELELMNIQPDEIRE
jgi:hypothetical protein